MWLGDFYKKVLITHKAYFKKRPLEIVDKNDEVVLAKWGDFGIMEGGKLCIKDKDGNLMSYGSKLNHVLYKPDAFENMVRRGRFTIPQDKDGNWMEDIEYKELPEPLDAKFDIETGKVKRINWSKVKTKVVKDIIADYLEKVNYLSGELEMKEGVVIKLKGIISDLQRSNRTLSTEVDISETNLSKSLFAFTETQKRLSDLNTQLSKLTELKATYESLLDKKDYIIEMVINKLDASTDPRFDTLKETIMSDLERAKALLPDQVTINAPEHKEQRQPVQPNEPIKA